MKKVGILYHPFIEAASGVAREVADFLHAHGVASWVSSAWEVEKASSLLNGTEMLLTTGGDGTILRAAQVAYPSGIPVAGINLGKLGFMTELSTGEVKEKLPALLDGRGWIDERAMLEVGLLQPGQTSPGIYHALNDLVIAHGTIARMINVAATIDGELLTTYRADGVIVATATGSTAYSLASGGPILHPQAKEFLLLPILPHLGSSYKLVLPSTTEVELRLCTTHEAAMSIDGHINIPLANNAMIKVKRSPEIIRFLRIHPRSFYSTLEQRLKGKQ
ncbi:MAG: NAD(+)/NADH kinase [Chloroflexi bacterium]|nr:NAD(+)/NADH kinase [Chloroflexota bacterium]